MANLPEWVMDRIKRAYLILPDVDFGKVTIVVDLDYAAKGIGSARVKISHEETHRPPKT